MPNYFPERRLFRCFSNFRSTNDVPNAVFNPNEFLSDHPTLEINFNGPGCEGIDGRQFSSEDCGKKEKKICFERG